MLADQQALPLEGTPRRLLRATPSRLAAFAECARRYRLSYLQRPPPVRGPAWAHNSLGAAVHVALKRVYDQHPGQRTPFVAGRLLVDAWQPDGFRDAAQSHRWRDLAQGWVEDYVGGIDPLDEPPGVERTVAARTPLIALQGRIDRLDDREGDLVVVDYKTGRVPPTDDDARTSPALALYAVAAASTLRRPCTRVELHHVRSGQVAVFEHNEASLARQLARAESIAVDIVLAEDTLSAGGPVDEVFPPSPSTRCGWCDFRGSCPEGQAASTQREPWSALGDDVAP